MNTHQTHGENLMKKNHNLSPCTVQSVSYTPERRVMTFTSTAASPIDARPASRRRKPSLRLKIRMATESTTSFEPVIKVRKHAKT